MSSAAANDPSADRPEWAQAAYKRQLATLSRLAELGMEVGEAIGGEARALKAEPSAAPTPEALRAFEIFPRIARAVRLTLMLEDKIIRHMLGEDVPPPKAGKDGTPDDWEPITEIRRIIVYPDGRERVAGDPRERVTAEEGDRPDSEFGRRRPAADPSFDETIEAVGQDIESAAEAILTDVPFQPQGRMLAPMSGELPPEGRRGPARSRGSPGGWG